MKSLICLPVLLVALVGCSQLPEEADYDVVLFNICYGHFTETMAEEVFLDLVANGALWSVERL
ncbi:MAG: hypothetical protein OSB19_15125 [Opitutaceae bacterium]|nr:hypothetical protein [Opitutaceae bacterium]